MSPTVVSAIQDAIHKANRILLITHVTPDGDAIGSLIAMGMVLRQLGKQVSLACDDTVPKRFHYLAYIEKIQNEINPETPYDLIIALDCGDAERMGQAYRSLPEPLPMIINIDHHVTNTQFGSINLVDSSANATAEIIFNLLPALGVSLTAEMATALLTGLVTDTLGFRTAGVNARTLNAASQLMDAGADLFTVTTHGLILKPFSTLLLWQKGLDKMRLEDGLLWTSINNKEREEIGHMAPSSSGLVNVMAEVYQSVISVVLLELANGQISVGFRCRPPYSVAELALNLGGGGHPLAAGCTLDGPLEKAEAMVVALSKETIRQSSHFARNGNPYITDYGLGNPDFD